MLLKNLKILHQTALHCSRFQQNHLQLISVGTRMILSDESHVVGHIKCYGEINEQIHVNKLCVLEFLNKCKSRKWVCSY